MKILLDECITNRLKNFLIGFDVFTVSGLGISGIKNGELLDYCCRNKFDILLTIDKNLVHQQHLDQFPVIIVVLNSPTSKLEDLVNFLPSFHLQLKNFEKHKAYLVER